MKLRATFKKDTDTWEMLGSKAGLVCYVCELWDSKDVKVGEGRGASSIAEKGNENTAIKIAEKRAKMDAVLSTGGLSDFFTQDLEDMMDTKSLDKGDVIEAEEQTSTNEFMSTFAQHKYIRDLLEQKGYTEKALLKKFDIFDLKELTQDQASDCISNLKNLFPRKKTPEGQMTEFSDEELDEIDAGIEEQRLQAK